MAVSSFCGTHSLVAQSPIVADWQQLSGFEWVKPFEEQERFAHDVGEARKRAGTLTELFEQNFNSSQNSKPVLRTILHRIVQWFGSETESELVGRSFHLASKSSCVTRLALGTFSSLLIQHPLLLFLGLSQCFPRVSAQQKVGSEFQVNTYTAAGQWWPIVASFSAGNFVVIWMSNGQDGSDWGVYGQLFNGTGAKIGSEFQVNNYTQDGQKTPSVTGLTNSNFVVTWHSDLQDGSSWGVYGQLFNETGLKIGNEFQINTHTTDSQSNPSVASLNNGCFVVTWASSSPVQDGSGYGIYGQLFNETGTKIWSEFQINTYTTNDQKLPRVTGLNSGNFVVIWSSYLQDGSDYGIYGQLFDEGGNKVGNEFRINSFIWNDQRGASIASLRAGNFIVAWTSDGQDGSNYGVYGQLFDGNGTKIGSEFQINTETFEDQSVPRITDLDNDHFIASWHSYLQEGSDYGVYGQLFNKDGSKIGNEFQVNTYTTDRQATVSCASLSNGNFVLTWHSLDQDGSDYGIYGQIFHDNWTLSSSSSTTSTSQTTSTTSRSITSNLPSSSTTTSTRITSVFSSTICTTHPKTFDRNSMTSESSQMISSSFSNRNNVLAWLAFFLGGAACVASFVHAGYSLYKSKRREERGDTIELREKGSLGGAPPLEVGGMERADSTEEHYQRTPDHVHPL